MTKDQREALTALRDVMEKYDIHILLSNVYVGNFEMLKNPCRFDLGISMFNHALIGREICSLSEPNDSKRVAGRDFTGTGGDV